ncbi:hypothetical protein DFH09DRAFT_1109811 [Mycena vulgaris]|nr:hypothetical protein DFH09DRAFT_1109811 [Mycena vulgaris]
MAGEVIAVGADVTQWKVGDHVSPNFMLDKLHDEQTAAIGATVLGGASHGVLTAYRTFPTHSRGATSSSFLTGGVSTFALQFAIASEASVISLSSSDDMLEATKKLGAKRVINYKTTPWTRRS